MSRQLAISAGFSVVATLAVALFAATGGAAAAHHRLTGAPAYAEAPALLPQPKLPLIAD
ncbi:MAG: hypothetical protein J7496_15920 [Novosphingobium sp.]|nr:hypothetical protein [Novosphingobium sp.]MBO9603989.1 hypothetical protein [Novosphingobium sp.]